MKTKTDCIPCVFKQSLATIRHITRDDQIIERVMRKIAGAYSKKSLQTTPAYYSQTAYDIISKETGVEDPFLDEKKKFNELVISMIPDCYVELEKSNDTLTTGAHLAVAGNIIDLGIGGELDIHGTLSSALKIPFAINHIERLREDLAKYSSLFYIGDNAGEIVFDRLFIEILKKLYPHLNIVFSVKSKPIINDATMDDALAVGMTEVCKVIETGGNYIGAPLDKVGKIFLKEYNSAEIIIAKGHGNFETLNEETEKNIYFILKAKCEMVANELGVSIGDSVLKHY